MGRLTASTDIMSPVALFLQADIVVKIVMVGPAPRQHLDLGDHLRPVAEDAPRAARQRGVRARFLEVRGYRRLLRGARRGRPARPPRCSPPASPNGAARPRARAVDRDGTRSRLAVAMHSAVAAETDRLASRLNILATVGSVAPFVGLFGTVWGIMRSFTDIAGAQNTASPWSRPASPRLCSRPLSACSRRSRR